MEAGLWDSDDETFPTEGKRNVPDYQSLSSSAGAGDGEKRSAGDQTWPCVMEANDSSVTGKLAIRQRKVQYIYCCIRPIIR